MKCPNCKKEIDDKIIAQHLGKKGGKPRQSDSEISDHAKYMRRWRAKQKTGEAQ